MTFPSRSTRWRLAAGTALAVGLLTLPAAIKAVYVSPHAVFMGHSSRSAQVSLGNPGDAPEEVTIDLQFGYPTTDSLGTPIIRFIDDPGPEYPSAAGWIRAFPRRARIEPGDKQVVRLLATPPADLPDGEYWTRFIVTSRGAAIPIATGDTAVRAGVTLEIRIVTSVTYRKGDVRTGVALRSLEVTATADSLIAWMDVGREGNAAYLGTAEFDVVDAGGSSARRWSVPLAVYYPIRRRFAFPLEGLASGAYTVEFALVAERKDLEEGQVLPALTVTHSAAITVP